MLQIGRTVLVMTPAIVGVVLLSSLNAMGVEKPLDSPFDFALRLRPLRLRSGQASTTLRVNSGNTQGKAQGKPKLPKPEIAQIEAIGNQDHDDMLGSETDSASLLEEPDLIGRSSDGKVTTVSELSDVQPTDWAFQAIQSLVERYGCIAGYPDGTFKGNRALTRYEFAAGLNACMDKVSQLIAANGGQGIRKEDLGILQKLQEQFATELTNLRGRVDSLEKRTAEIAAHQFSPSTKLNAESIFAFIDVGGKNASGQNIYSSGVLGTRTRLNFDTSFVGEDNLRVRLQVANLDALSNNTTQTTEGDLRFTTPTPYQKGSNQILLDALLYSFPIGKQTTVVLEGNAGAADDFTNTINPYIDGDGGNGALSQFGTRNPIYYLVNGTGLGIRHQFNDKLELSLGYLANNANDPSNNGGLFNGAYGAIAQLTVKPNEKFTFGLTYVNSYNNDFTANGSSGSNRANITSALLSDNGGLPSSLAPLRGSLLSNSRNSYGVEASWQISPKFVINSWGGYTATRILSTLSGATNRGDLSIWNWGVTLGFPDLLKAGSLGGIVVGMEPQVTSVSNSLKGTIGKDPNTAFHIEGFYQYKVSDYIAITPGLIWITSADDNKSDGSIVIGAIRTTFTF